MRPHNYLSTRFRRSVNSLLILLTFSLSFRVLASADDIDDIVHGPSDRLINFGVVIQNDDYTIYRSAHLGKVGMRHLSKYLDRHELPFPKTIIYMISYEKLFWLTAWLETNCASMWI
jgi:hypothetical protein